MIVYIIHFSKKLGHAQHYIGTTKVYKKRMAAHRANRGASILKACNERGIKWRVVDKQIGSRKLERKLKSRKDTASLCPVCKHKRRRQNNRTRRIRMASQRENKIVSITTCPLCKAQPGKLCVTVKGKLRGQNTSLHKQRREAYEAGISGQMVRDPSWIDRPADKHSDAVQEDD